MGIKVIEQPDELRRTVDAVHSSGKKLYEFVDLTLDNCAPAAEAMLKIDGIEANFMAQRHRQLLHSLVSNGGRFGRNDESGKTPLLLKSANFPGGPEYSNTGLSRIIRNSAVSLN